MLNNLKLLLGITDNGQDDRLQWLIETASNRLCILLGGAHGVPDDLEYVVVEVAAVRFNRIGSEGYSSHTVEGESISFSDDDFAAYANEIQAYINAQDDNKTGKVRFI